MSTLLIMCVFNNFRRTLTLNQPRVISFALKPGVQQHQGQQQTIMLGNQQMVLTTQNKTSLMTANTDQLRVKLNSPFPQNANKMLIGSSSLTKNQKKTTLYVNNNSQKGKPLLHTLNNVSTKFQQQQHQQQQQQSGVSSNYSFTDLIAEVMSYLLFF